MTTIREALEKANAEVSGEATETPAAPPDAPAQEAPPAPEVEAAAPEVPPTEGRARDDKGRFAPGSPEAKAAAQKVAPNAGGAPGLGSALTPGKPAASGSPVGAPASTPAPEALKAPSSWKPAAREAFAKAPPEVQAEALRVDREVRAVMQEAAPAKQFAQAMHQVLSPHEALLRADGVHPVQAIGNLLQTYSQLRSGTPQQRVAILADLFRQSGASVEDFAAALDAPQAPAQRQPQQQPLDVRGEVTSVLAELQQQALAAKAQRDIAALTEAKEYGQDPRVRAHMAALLSSGQKYTLEEAYEEACWAIKDIRASLQKRDAEAAANASPASTQRARAAASSLKSQPAGDAHSAPKRTGIRASLEAAEAALSKR